MRSFTSGVSGLFFLKSCTVTHSVSGPISDDLEVDSLAQTKGAAFFFAREEGTLIACGCEFGEHGQHKFRADALSPIWTE